MPHRSAATNSLFPGVVQEQSSRKPCHDDEHRNAKEPHRPTSPIGIEMQRERAPLGIDVAQAERTLEIAKRVRQNQSVDIGFQCRNAPPIAALAEKIKAGALGKIAVVCGNYNAPVSTEKQRNAIGPS